MSADFDTRTLPKFPCPVKLCAEKADGNYPYANPDNNIVNEHYYVHCSSGVALCQPCWPSHLVFKPSCNQCLYSTEGTKKNSPINIDEEG